MCPISSCRASVSGRAHLIGLGVYYIPIAAFIIVAASNAVNFTDGLDGLAGLISATIFAAYGVIALMQGQVFVARFCFTMVGALFGFLWFNVHPAQLFMGDTGSLCPGEHHGSGRPDDRPVGPAADHRDHPGQRNHQRHHSNRLFPADPRAAHLQEWRRCICILNCSVVRDPDRPAILADRLAGRHARDRIGDGVKDEHRLGTVNA